MFKLNYIFCSFSSSQVMVPHPSSSSNDSSSHHNSSTNHSKGSHPPQLPLHLINPPFPHHKHSSTTQLLTKHRHPNHLPFLSHLSLRHLLPRLHTTVSPHSRQLHALLQHSLHGLNHHQYQCISLKLPMLYQHRCNHQDSMVLKDSPQCRFSIQQAQLPLGLLMLAPLQLGLLQWALIHHHHPLQ